MQALRKFKSSNLAATNPCIPADALAEKFGGANVEYDLISILDLESLEFYQRFWPLMQSAFSSAKARVEVCYFIAKHNDSQMVLPHFLAEIEAAYPKALTGDAEAFTVLLSAAFKTHQPADEAERQLLVSKTKEIITQLAQSDELY